MSAADGELIVQAVLMAPVAIFLWWFVIRVCRQLATRDLMDDCRPTQAEIHAIEVAHLPKEWL